MKTLARTIFAVLAGASLAACARKSSPQAPKDAGSPLTSFPATAGSAAATPAGQGTAVAGKILETMDSGGYTYMRLATPAGETWAAVNASKVKTGETVTVVNAVPMDGFQSNTLHRKFDHIWFGTLASGPVPQQTASGAPDQPSPSDPRYREMMAAQHSAAARGPAADVGDIKVPKAEGPEGKTVAEIFAGRQSLKDKEAAVRGKVVKFNPGIMGRNWMHLRDGSGTPAMKNNDLTVTTSETAAVGDVVTARGKVHVDRDFGAGYSYPVMIEEAKVSK
jgi:hypothetical protein